MDAKRCNFVNLKGFYDSLSDRVWHLKFLECDSYRSLSPVASASATSSRWSAIDSAWAPLLPRSAPLRLWQRKRMKRTRGPTERKASQARTSCTIMLVRNSALCGQLKMKIGFKKSQDLRKHSDIITTKTTKTFRFCTSILERRECI